MTKKVVLLNVNYPNYHVEQRILSPFDAEISHASTGDDLAASIAAARDAFAVMVRETHLPEEFINSLENCTVIVRYGVGVDNIDLEAARKRRIYVANVSDYGSDTVADHAIALMYAVARRIVRRDSDVRAGIWGVGAEEPLFSFTGKTLGVAGCGKIGRALIKKCSSLGFARVLGYDPYSAYSDGVEMTDLHTLLKNADVVSLHMPLNSETRHIINKNTLSWMKPNAILVNTSRGDLINQKDLVEALIGRVLFGVGMDVFEVEPPQVDRDALFSLTCVTVSDHTGWYSVESLENLQRLAAMEVARVFNGQEPESWVNPWDM